MRGAAVPGRGAGQDGGAKEIVRMRSNTIIIVVAVVIIISILY